MVGWDITPEDIGVAGVDYSEGSGCAWEVTNEDYLNPGNTCLIGAPRKYIKAPSSFSTECVGRVGRVKSVDPILEVVVSGKTYVCSERDCINISAREKEIFTYFADVEIYGKDYLSIPQMRNGLKMISGELLWLYRLGILKYAMSVGTFVRFNEEPLQIILKDLQELEAPSSSCSDYSEEKISKEKISEGFRVVGGDIENGDPVFWNTDSPGSFTGEVLEDEPGFWNTEDMSILEAIKHAEKATNPCGETSLEEKTVCQLPPPELEVPKDEEDEYADRINSLRTHLNKLEYASIIVGCRPKDVALAKTRILRATWRKEPRETKEQLEETERKILALPEMTRKQEDRAVTDIKNKHLVLSSRYITPILDKKTFEVAKSEIERLGGELDPEEGEEDFSGESHLQEFRNWRDNPYS